MKTSEKCKSVGLKSLVELSEITGESVQTINNWSKNKPALFKVVLTGSIQIKVNNGLGGIVWRNE